MNDFRQLTALSGAPSPSETVAARWSPIPPRAVRQAVYQWVKEARRPAGTLAVPAMATVGSLYYSGVIPHGDAPMALGLTALTVFYDAVIVVCRTWQSTRAAHGAEMDHPAQQNKAA